MINAYVVGITNHYEGEDIEVRYSIYDEQELLSKRSFFKEYKKPLVVNHVALLTLLKDLKKHRGKEIVILINDASLDEQIKGTSQTKKIDVLKMASKLQDELNKFGGTVVIEDVSKNTIRLREWNERLRFP